MGPAPGCQPADRSARLAARCHLVKRWVLDILRKYFSHCRRRAHPLPCACTHPHTPGIHYYKTINAPSHPAPRSPRGLSAVKLAAHGGRDRIRPNQETSFLLAARICLWAEESAPRPLSQQAHLSVCHWARAEPVPPHKPLQNKTPEEREVPRLLKRAAAGE